MTENTENPIPFTPVKTYRQLSQAEIDWMNNIKDVERGVADLLARVRVEVHNLAGVPVGTVPLPSSEDGKRLNESMRQIALARTSFEVAFMHLSRAVAKPDSPWL